MIQEFSIFDCTEKKLSSYLKADYLNFDDEDIVKIFLDTGRFSDYFK